MGSYSIILLLLLVVLSVWRLFNRRRKSLPLPPGPPGLPIVGNLLDMPKTYEYETYREWSRQFGTIMTILLLPG